MSFSLIACAGLSVAIFTARADDYVVSSSFEITREDENGTRALLQRDFFTVEYSTKTFPISITENHLSIGLELVTNETDVYGDIEKVDLLVCGASLPPTQARYADTGEDVLEDVVSDDLNVVVATNLRIDVMWENLPDCSEDAVLRLTANQYVSPESRAFRFPERSEGNVAYPINNNQKTLLVDGKIDEVDGTRQPDYSPYWLPGTGHPVGYTYLYFNNDENYFYVSADVTIDNSNELGKDWIEMRITNSTGQEQIFRINDEDNTYGRCSFGLTHRVSYKHNTCEFAIPVTS